jgi:polysaccharide pyruvyl transferase CsaB
MKNSPHSGPRILVSGWVGAANIGDELIFRSLADKLQQRDVQILAMSTDPDETRRLHGVDAVGWYDAPGVIRAVASSDALIFGPGGLLQDETSIWNLPAHLHRVFAAKMARTPILGLGLGVGPLGSGTSRRLVRTALRSTPITVRDQESATLAAECGLSNVTVTADLAYGLPIPFAEPADRIVASFRPFSGGGGVIPARRSDLRSLAPDDRVLAAASALDDLSRRTSLPVHLLAFEAERDALYHGLIADHMTAAVTTGVATVDSAFEEIARSRLVVAMRYHAVVAAIMATRPAVVVGYSPKVRPAAHLLGKAGLLIANDPVAYRDIADGAALVGRDSDVAAAREERRNAEIGNDEALDRFLSNL